MKTSTNQFVEIEQLLQSQHIENQTEALMVMSPIDPINDVPLDNVESDGDPSFDGIHLEQLSQLINAALDKSHLFPSYQSCPDANLDGLRRTTNQENYMITSNIALSLCRVAWIDDKYKALICTYDNTKPVYQVCTEHIVFNPDGSTSYIYTNPVHTIDHTTTRDSYREALKAFRQYVQDNDQET